MSAKETIGKRFGFWTVISLGTTKRRRAYLVRCKCDCGTEREVLPASLKNGSSFSCGCYQRARTSEAARKHGLSRTPTYVSWRSMLGRCYDPGNASHDAYSAKGITVCERWLNSFENFLEDMGERPSKSHSLDRIDNDGNYTKENCRWATAYQQQANRSCTRMLTALGQTKPMSEWARLNGMQYQTLKARLKNGWSANEAVTRPVEFHNMKPKALYPGVTITEV